MGLRRPRASGRWLGGFGHRDQVYNGDGEPTRLILSDFNNDGKPDIAVNAPDEGIMLIYLNNGKGGFSSRPRNWKIFDAALLASGDFNKRRNMDLVAAQLMAAHNRELGNVVALLGDGTGGFHTAHRCRSTLFRRVSLLEILTTMASSILSWRGPNRRTQTGIFSCLSSVTGPVISLKSNNSLGKGHY